MSLFHDETPIIYKEKSFQRPLSCVSTPCAWVRSPSNANDGTSSSAAQRADLSSHHTYGLRGLSEWGSRDPSGGYKDMYIVKGLGLLDLVGSQGGFKQTNPNPGALEPPTYETTHNIGP